MRRFPAPDYAALHPGYPPPQLPARFPRTTPALPTPPRLAPLRMHPHQPRIGLIVDGHAAERAFHRKPFGFSQRLGPVGQQLLDHLRPRAFQLRQRHHLMHQADAPCVIGAEALAGQRVAADLAHADGIAELRNDDRRRQAPAHLRDREQRVVGRDHHVAGRDHAGAAAKAAALHQRHRRDRQGIEPLHRLEGRARHRLVFLRRFRPHAVDPFQVRAGLEMLAVALQHHDAKLRFLAEFVHRRQHAIDQGAIIGVVDLRAVQRDGRDPARVEDPTKPDWQTSGVLCLLMFAGQYARRSGLDPSLSRAQAACIAWRVASRAQLVETGAQASLSRTSPMRICIFGAGAVGSHFAVRLAQAGHDVSCVMRGPHLAAVKAKRPDPAGRDCRDQSQGQGFRRSGRSSGRRMS